MVAMIREDPGFGAQYSRIALEERHLPGGELSYQAALRHIAAANIPMLTPPPATTPQTP
jgi:hypothetical protein